MFIFPGAILAKKLNFKSEKAEFFLLKTSYYLACFVILYIKYISFYFFDLKEKKITT